MKYKHLPFLLAAAFYVYFAITLTADVMLVKKVCAQQGNLECGPVVTQSPTPTPEPSRSPEPTPTPTVTPEPTSTPFTHVACNTACDGDDECRAKDKSYRCTPEKVCRLISAPERDSCDERPESTEQPKSVVLPDLGVQPLGVQK